MMDLCLNVVKIQRNQTLIIDTLSTFVRTFLYRQSAETLKNIIKIKHLKRTEIQSN